MRFAILDDDKAQTELVAKLLQERGDECEVFHAGRALLNRLRQDMFDLIVIDWNMPGLSGIEVLGHIRQGPLAKVPVLMVTSRSDEIDIVAGLAAGADDYIAKPLLPAVFLARVDAALRRSHLNRPKATEARFGHYVFDLPTETVAVRGEPVKLTAKELTLALTLFENQSRPLSRSWLLETIWGASPDVETRTLDAHISRIRAKLSLRAENGFRILPVYSYGYRLEPTGDTGFTDVAGDDVRLVASG